MTPADVVRAFWDRIGAHDWDAAGALLAPDVVLEYPHTGERFDGRDTVIAINAQYPDGWSIDDVRTVTEGRTVVSEVRVPQDGVGTFVAVTFWQVDADLLVAAREYWVHVGGEEAPAWRRRFGS